MCAACGNIQCASFFQSVCSICDCTCCVDHIVNQDNSFAFDITDDVHNFADICFRSAFVDDRNGNVQFFCKFSNSCYRAQIGRNCNEIFFQSIAVFVDVVIYQQRAADQVIYGNIKEALDLCTVQIHCQNAVSTCACQQICNQFCTDGISGSCFSVLTSIAVVRHNCCDSCCGCTFHSIDHDQQFHQVVVYRIRCGLNDEYVRTTDCFIDFNGNFAIAEFFYFTVAQFQAQFGYDGFCQFLIGIAGKYFNVANAGIKHKSVPL